MTEILHHLLTCLSTLSLRVRGYKLCISKCKLIEVAQDFFHPPNKKKEFLYIWSCKFLPAVSYFQGINSIAGSSHSSPSVLHPSPAHSLARGKISYMAAAARNTANHPQHPRYTTRNTTRNTAEMLSEQKNRPVFSCHSLKASKLQNAVPASSSVVLRVV